MFSSFKELWRENYSGQESMEETKKNTQKKQEHAAISSIAPDLKRNIA